MPNNTLSQAQLKEFLSRVDLIGSLDDLLIHTTQAYRIGTLQSHKILPNGYQELNVLISTTLGKYVVKIFSKEKPLQRIQDNIWGYVTFQKQGVPMPSLVKSIDNDYLMPIPGIYKTSYLCVMEYSNGAYVYPNILIHDDIRRLARYMAIIHTNTKRIRRYYDTMGLVNLLSQYKKFQIYLDSKLRLLIDPLAHEYASVHFNKFRQSNIHGTFEYDNILKDVNGRICILDLGCMDYTASVVDIATFLANYTINHPLHHKRTIALQFLESYNSVHHLTPVEYSALPTLVRAQYAAYTIRTNYYRVKYKDRSKQTKHWFDLGVRGLKQYADIQVL